MAFYRIIEFEPKDWTNTDTILVMGGKHYHTLMKGNGTDTFIRKFIIDLSDEDLVFARLRFGPEVDIGDIPEHELPYLKEQGYLK